MKKYFGKKLTLALVAFLALAGIVYSQTSFTEIEGFLRFRPATGQIRVATSISVADLTGLLSRPFSSARLVITTPAGAAATRTLLPTECGAVVINNGTSSTQTYTLPVTATNPGCMFTFITGHADGEILINAATASDDCIFTHFAAVGADADTAIVTDAACEVGIKNTTATNAIGDSITLVSDGGIRWLGVGIASGVWAVQ